MFLDFFCRITISVQVFLCTFSFSWAVHVSVVSNSFVSVSSFYLQMFIFPDFFLAFSFWKKTALLRRRKKPIVSNSNRKFQKSEFLLGPSERPNVNYQKKLLPFWNMARGSTTGSINLRHHLFVICGVCGSFADLFFILGLSGRSLSHRLTKNDSKLDCKQCIKQRLRERRTDKEK